jgi:predicted Zn-dependent peptidase
MKPTLITLPNGVRLLVIAQPAAATATVLVLVGTGSKYETKSENGLSHFLEHMCFKGTTNLPTAKDVVESFDRIGAISNAFTSTEYTGYYAKGGPNNVKTFLTVLSDIYLHSTFPEIEIEKEKGVIIEEINMYEDMPQQKVGEALTALLYGDQPAGWPIIGSKENVKAFTRQDFVDYKAKHYHAENTIIVVSGAVTMKEIKPLVVKAFGSLNTARATTKKKVSISKESLKCTIVEKKSDQAHIAIGFHSIPFGHADAPVIGLLTTLLGRGMSSRLSLALREEMGVAYYVGASQESHTDHGVFEIMAGIDKDRVTAVFERIATILTSIKEVEVSAQELTKAREYTLGIARLGLESSDDIAGFYAVQLLMKKTLKMPATIAREYQAVTPRDIKRLARKILTPQNMSIAIVGPFTKEDIDLKPFLNL